MTTLLIIINCLAFLNAFFLGRAEIINYRRAERIKQQENEIKRLDNRLDKISDSNLYDRFYEIEEDEIQNRYNVNLKVHVYAWHGTSYEIENVCYALIKPFPFADDKAFALREAQELLEKLNEK